MASSLSDLLAEEVFHRRQKSPRDQSFTIPLYICQTQSSSKRRGTRPEERSSSNLGSVLSEPSWRDSPAIDEVSVRDVVSILSGYVGRYAKDGAFREKVREKCLSCLVSTRRNYEILEKLEVGIESVDSLVEERGAIAANSKRVRSTAQILSVVASSQIGERDSGSHLSACAQLYMAILHKLERNDVKSARHLLEVFCDSPFLARTHLAPDLWEHFFLPHLLHLKVWFSNEIECLSGSDERRAKTLSKAYNAQVDIGTVEFASYYKKWLKVGLVGLPSVPVIPLPTMPYRELPRRSSMESCSTNSFANKSLYNAVFGPTSLRQSASLISRSGTLNDMWDSNREDSVIIEKMMSGFSSNRSSSLHERHRSRRRSSSSQYERYQKPENFRFFGCQQTLPLECSLTVDHLPKNGSLRRKEESPSNLNLSPQLARAVEAVSSSDSLEECESAILTISKSWPDRGLEAALSKTPAMEGILEVLLASEDEEVCEAALSLVGRSELSRLMVLNADPQLEAFRRHLRSSGRLFLRAAEALHLLRPAAMNMAANEWLPLVLRLLEFGGAAAAFYLLRQLLTGFEDEDRNIDNARQVVCLGGLGVIAAIVGGAGEVSTRFDATEFVLRCVRADGSCRNYLSEGLSVEALLELVLIECRRTAPGGPAIELLFELFCLNRTQVIRMLEKVKEGWGGFNAMHILFAYLQKAKPKDRPLIAAILLQLDLLGDLSKPSVFREEAVEAIIEALDCTTHNSDFQEQSARALLILSGRLSYTGEPSIENWLLQNAGLDGVSVNAFQRHDQNGREGEEAMECWQRKTAAVLVRSGSERFMVGLSECIRNGIPRLSRASLVTASWMFMYFGSASDEKLQPNVCSTLVPCLVECLSHDNDVEARVIATYTLLSLSKTSAECASMIRSSGKDELLSHLKHLQLVTWAANKLLSIITS